MLQINKRSISKQAAIKKKKVEIGLVSYTIIPFEKTGVP